jgi:hypothetical protein
VSLSESRTAKMGRVASHLCHVRVQQQELLQLSPQPQPPQLFPQLFPQPKKPPLPPQQQHSRTMMMITHRQEQLFPELKHMIVTSLANLSHSMLWVPVGNLTIWRIPRTSKNAQMGQSVCAQTHGG